MSSSPSTVTVPAGIRYYLVDFTDGYGAEKTKHQKMATPKGTSPTLVTMKALRPAVALLHPRTETD
jgi:hypothetical protein